MAVKITKQNQQLININNEICLQYMKHIKMNKTKPTIN